LFLSNTDPQQQQEPHHGHRVSSATLGVSRADIPPPPPAKQKPFDDKIRYYINPEGNSCARLHSNRIKPERNKQ